MNLADLLTFAKAGYTPAQVKELLSMPLNEDIKKEEIEESKEKLQEVEEKIEIPEENIIVKETEKQIDYKTLYEDSQKKLQEAQKQNINQNIQGKTEDDQEIVTRFISSFL